MTQQIEENVVVKKSDPTTKAMDILIADIMDHKRTHQMKSNKPRNARTEILPTSTLKASIPKKNQIVSKRPKKKSNEPLDSSQPQKKVKKDGKFSTAEKIPDDFGFLKMDKLDVYEIPYYIFDAENNENHIFWSSISGMVESAMTDRFKYTEIYTLMLQLEEAAEILSLKKYNLSHMKLSFTGLGRRFKIKTDVSLIQIYLK